MMTKTVFRFATLLPLSLLILTGCATRQQPIYGWGNYQQQVYEYFKADTKSNEEQIAALEESIQKNRSKGAPLPPGYHAHLGMLYANAGKPDMVVQEFETEKALFPESAPYMNFLLAKLKK
ncbi:DUF4810 domain-containing protein [Herbaspirillum sp. 3R11]|jgi:hypothetical protein|uniref:DUF4810 domain-containing protein n=1 Tax=unclassified Herbaspirillum TaxID=2624150 RepID=UPI0032AE92D1